MSSLLKSVAHIEEGLKKTEKKNEPNWERGFCSDKKMLDMGSSRPPQIGGQKLVVKISLKKMVEVGSYDMDMNMALFCVRNS